MLFFWMSLLTFQGSGEQCCRLEFRAIGSVGGGGTVSSGFGARFRGCGERVSLFEISMLHQGFSVEAGRSSLWPASNKSS